MHVYLNVCKMFPNSSWFTASELTPYLVNYAVFMWGERAASSFLIWDVVFRS